MKKNKHIKKKNKSKQKRRKIRFDRIFMCLFLIFLVGYIVYLVINKPITNIYIFNNDLLNDQYIIDKAGLRDYPKALSFSTFKIKKVLEDDPLIKEATVKRKLFKTVEIKVKENKPIVYYQPDSKTILEDGTKINEKYDVPVLINFVPDKIYNQLINQLSQVNKDVFGRISTIKYDPNDVDSGRFLLSMNDSNYVYLSINKFTDINNYIKIMTKFENKKGILYLDSGEYFKVMENF